jgi:hypothetical protein
MQYLLRNKISIAILCVCLSSAAMAQRDEVFRPNQDQIPYNFGFSISISDNLLGVNRGNMFLPTNSFPANSITEITPINNLYFNFGLIGTMKLNKYVSLRTNPTFLNIGSKNLAYIKVNTTPDLTEKINLSSSIIHLPLALKFQSDRYNGFKYADFMRHYIIVGGKFDFDLSNKNAGKIISLPSPTTTSISALTPSYPSNLRGSDWGAEIGVGVSLYFRYFTLSPEIKYSHGLRNIHKSNLNNTLFDNLDKINANYVYFTIHFEN